MIFDASSRPPRRLSFLLFDIFQRIVAVACLIAGLQYWALLIGLHGGMWRFDVMPVHWQVAAAALAVLFPVTAVGLWMPVSWGPVIWFVAACIEVTMHLGFPDLFGERPLILVMHGVVALLYAIFRFVLFLEKRRSRRPVRVDSL